jgi:hypothetical protein
MNQKDFKNLSASEKDAQQRAEAQAIVRRITNGEVVSDAELRFVEKITGRNWGTVNTEGVNNAFFGGAYEMAQMVKNSLPSFEWNVILPIIALLVAVYFVLKVWKQ